MSEWEKIARNLAEEIERLHSQGVVSTRYKEKIMLEFDAVEGNWRNIAGVMYQACLDKDYDYAVKAYLMACGADVEDEDGA